ncbi:hypothetical protein [Cupriavidus sp. MP-37]|uniref:hypothetical protein n=1 Tax=Cupriavidus sp. MP-37 TaxID=2884455 RepID=UPI001D0A5298|nr:hypothetical protein [Cupriavidus sp. MP-37]UDM48892.1 hypothetical protein LIN44_09485 [Cupriavidus sp. MP-37]
MPVPQDPRLGACCYLLHLLLQRTELAQPGFLDQLIAGVTVDRDGMAQDAAGREAALPVFDEALRMLSVASEQLKQAPART